MNYIRNHKTLLGSVIGLSVVTGASIIGYLVYEKLGPKKRPRTISPRSEERANIVPKELIIQIISEIQERSKAEGAQITARCRKLRRSFDISSPEYRECVRRHQQ